MTGVTVLVVGAGPTGLLLASELLRRGVACRIIDAHPSALPWDRATVVHPRSLEVLESLGLSEPLLAAGVKQRMARIHSGGSVLGEIDLSLCGSRYGFNIGVSEEVTERILTDYLGQQGGEVVRSCCLVALEEQKDGLLVTTEHNGLQEKLFAQWVVGCDGHESAVRKFAGIELVGQDIPEPWAVFDAVAANWPNSYEAIYAYLDEIPVILTALPDKRWRVYLRPRTPDSDLLADAMSTLASYLPDIHLEDVTNPNRFHCQSKVATRFRSGRILLAGDAAHLCTPTQGHGMNTGLQDAHNLAWKLALVCAGASSADLLDSYEAERRPVAQAIVASGDEIERAQTLIDPAERRLRDEAFRAALSDPSKRRQGAVAEAELDIDYGGSPIVIGDDNDRLAAGQRLPDTIGVHDEGEPNRKLHELAHRAGHTSLVVGGPSTPPGELTLLAGSIVGRTGGPFIEAAVVLTAAPDGGSDHRALAPAAVGRLGVDDITLLVVRPDGHIGLRADRDHAQALSAYEARLASGGLEPAPAVPAS